MGTGSIGTLWMAGLVGATWDPPVSPAAGAYLWMAGGILLLLSGAFLLDREADAPVSPGRRGPLLVFLAVAVGLFTAAEVVGAVLRNYITGASLWVAGIVVLLAAGTWAVVGAVGSKTTSTALRRTGVLATVVAGAALVLAGYLVPVGMFSEAFVSARADRLIFLEIPQHWTGIAFDAVFPVTVVVLGLAVAFGALGSRMSPATRAILVALGAVALARFITEIWDAAIHPEETLAAGGLLGLAGGVLLLAGAQLAHPRAVAGEL